MYVTVKARPTLVKLSKDEYYARYLEEMTNHLDFDNYSPQDPMVISGFNHWFTTLAVNAVDFFFRYSNPTFYNDKPHFDDLIEAHATYLRESKLCPCEVDDVVWGELVSSLADLESRFVDLFKEEFKDADFIFDFWSVLSAKSAAILFRYEGDFRIYEWNQGRGKGGWIGSSENSTSLPESTWERIGQLLDNVDDPGSPIALSPHGDRPKEFATTPTPDWLRNYQERSEQLAQLERDNDLDARCGE
jgi:hypothetical protein